MSQVTWLRTSFWAGAIADVLFGVLTLVPARTGETEFRYLTLPPGRVQFER